MLKKILSRIQFNYMLLLKILCVLSCLAAFYSILTYGQTVLHGDTATGTILSQAQMKHHSLFPKTWNYVYGDIWVVTTHTFTTIFSAILRNQSLARMLGSCMLVLISSLLMAFNNRKIYQDDSWVLSIPVVLVFIADQVGFFGNAGSTQDSILYQAAYQYQIINLVLFSALFYIIYQENAKKIYYFIFVIYLFLMCFSGMRNIAEISVTLVATVSVFEYIKLSKEFPNGIKDRIKALVKYGLIIGVPTVAGYLCHELFMTNHYMRCSSFTTGMNFPASLSTVYERTIDVLLGSVTVFGFTSEAGLFSGHGIQNLVSIGIAILMVFVVPVLQLFKIKQESFGVKYMFVFTLIHNIVIFVTIVLFGIGGTGRYLLTSVIALIIVSSRYILEYWIKPYSLHRYFWIAAFILATLIECLVLLGNSRGWRNTLDEKKALSAELIDRGLTKGYASYWYAYNNQVYSDNKITYCGVDIESGFLTYYYWLCDMDSYNIEADKSFVLLGPSEKIYEEYMYDVYGKPVDTFNMNDMYVYIYDYDIIDKIASGCCGGINTPQVMKYSDSEIMDDGTMRINPKGSAYGPGTHLFAGEYTVIYSGKNVGSATCDVYSAEHPDSISIEEISRTNDEVAIRLKTTYDRLLDAEFRVNNNSDEPLYLENITVK